MPSSNSNRKAVDTSSSRIAIANRALAAGRNCVECGKKATTFRDCVACGIKQRSDTEKVSKSAIKPEEAGKQAKPKKTKKKEAENDAEHLVRQVEELSGEVEKGKQERERLVACLAAEETCMLEALKKIDESRRLAVAQLRDSQIQVQDLAEKNRLLAAGGLQEQKLGQLLETDFRRMQDAMHQIEITDRSRSGDKVLGTWDENAMHDALHPSEDAVGFIQRSAAGLLQRMQQVAERQASRGVSLDAGCNTSLEESPRESREGADQRAEVVQLESALWGKIKEISDLQQMMKKLEGEVVELSAEARREHAWRKEAQAAQESAQAHAQELEEQLEEERRARRAEADAQHSAASDAQQQRAQREEEAAAHRQEALSLENALWAKGKEVSDLQQMMQKLEAEVKKLSEEVERESTAREEAEREREAARKEARELRGAMERGREREKADKVDAECSTEREAWIALERAAESEAKLQEELSSLQAAQARLEGDVARLREEVQREQAEREAAQEEAKRLKRSLEEAVAKAAADAEASARSMRAEQTQRSVDSEGWGREARLELEAVLWSKGTEINELQRMLQKMEAEVLRANEEAAAQHVLRDQAEERLEAARGQLAALAAHAGGGAQEPAAASLAARQGVERSERERVAQREEVLVLEDKLWKKGKELEELHTRTRVLEGEVGRLSEEIEKEFQWRKEAVLGKEALLQELKDLQCRLLHAETQLRQWQTVAEGLRVEGQRKEEQLQVSSAELARLERVVRDAVHIFAPAASSFTQKATSSTSSFKHMAASSDALLSSSSALLDETAVHQPSPTLRPTAMHQSASGGVAGHAAAGVAYPALDRFMRTELMKQERSHGRMPG